MTEDFYCDEVLSGRTAVKVVRETDDVLAYHHTRPFWPVHIVVIPKRHISSLLTLEETDDALLLAELVQHLGGFRGEADDALEGGYARHE